MARVLVTGGSRGLGLACARTLRDAGHELTVLARTAGQVQTAAAELGGQGIVHDVAQPLPDGLAFDAAVCAAGVIGEIGTTEHVEPRSLLDAYAINVVGVLHALATVPKGAPVVVFGGGGATAPFVRFDAYAASKAALVRLVENLAADGHRINAVAPGFVVTEMQDAVLRAGRERVGDPYFDKVTGEVSSQGGEDPQVAADCVAWLLSDAADGVTGKLLAAKWDPWQDPAFVQRLRDEPDLATLRRIDDQFFLARAR